MIGRTVAHYRITAKLGEGGMGEVYRARDTKLDRDVAIKVLPAALSNNAERMARFEREAKVLAALNHPNIAAIYGLEDRAIVMELVEGPTLAERIRSGPLELKDALGIALAIANALEAAHEKGIVHRDLKPSNVKAPPEATVKVLDLGLATVLPDADRDGASNAADSPTLTMGATEAGVIMGTAAYMSPEQASGRRVDKRADIWSFGVVLWEMLTGSRLFAGGETVSHTLADVLRAEIDFGKLPGSTPQAIRQLLKRCLDRNVKTRLRDIGEARIVLANPVASEPPPVVTAPSRSPLRWMVAAVLLVALATVSFIHFREQPPEQQPLRYTIAPPVNSTVHSFAISPNGRHLAVAAAINGKTQLWLRALDALQMQPISGTDGALYPFWSPDSRYIAFFAQGRLKKIATTGGPAQSLCDVPSGMGGSWNRDDVIVFASAPSNGLIQRVSASGGTPSDVIKIRAAYKMPIFLPDGRHFLYELNLAPEKNGIYLGSLDNGESRLVLTDQSTAVFRPLSPESRAGHLIFIREGTLMAQAFDSGSGQLTGEVFPVAEGVSLAQFRMMPVSLSQNGTLVYVAGPDSGLAQIAWFDRTGKNLGDVGAPGAVVTPAISPDEKTVAYTRVPEAGGGDIWLHDQARGRELRFTSDGAGNFAPFWAPKGERILFGVQSVRGMVLNVKSATGSGEKEPLLETNTNRRRPFQWSRDGRLMVYGETAPNGRDHLWVVPVDDKPASERKPIQFLQTEFNEVHGQLSADSRWMAYVSDESGERQVYVRPFPTAEGVWPISTRGGDQPRWRGDGKELFYVAADGKMMAVPIKTGSGPKASLEPGTPVSLFDSHISSTSNMVFQYDVTSGGMRFLISTVNGRQASSPFTVLVNWSAGLKK